MYTKFLSDLKSKTSMYDSDSMIIGDQNNTLKRANVIDAIKGKIINWSLPDDDDKTTAEAINEINQAVNHYGNIAESRYIVGYSNATIDKDGFSGTGNLTMDVSSSAAGFRYDQAIHYDPNTDYQISFWIRKESGTCQYFGMYNGKSVTFTRIRINGVDVSTSIVNGNSELSTIIDTGGYHFIIIQYRTPSTIPTDTGVQYMYVQPNGRVTALTGSYNILNFTFSKV